MPHNSKRGGQMGSVDTKVGKLGKAGKVTGKITAKHAGKYEDCGVRRRIAARSDKPLYSQFRAQRDTLAMTNQGLAGSAGVSLSTVSRELGVEPEDPMSLQLAQRLGDTLGFDPAHVALVHARDVAHAQERSRKVSEQVKERFRRIRKALDDYLRKQNPFTLRGSNRRLALTFERCKRKISLSRLAAHIRNKTAISAAQLSPIRTRPVHCRRRDIEYLGRSVPRACSR